MVAILASLAAIANIDASTTAWARRTEPWRTHIAVGEGLLLSGTRPEAGSVPRSPNGAVDVLVVGVVELAKVITANNQAVTPLAMANRVNSASERTFKVLVSMSLSGSDGAHRWLP